MFAVRFTATVNNPDTEETFNGWVDPEWSMFELRTDKEDVRATECATHELAVEFIEETIGSVQTDDRESYYAEDSRMNLESGEDWSYAAHIEEI